MIRCDFTDGAKLDLEDIADYTLKYWGKQQTFKYLNEIYEKTIALSHNPNLGTLRSDIYLTILSFPIRKHVIYYIKQKQGITVIRILHTQMNPKIRNFSINKLIEYFKFCSQSLAKLETNKSISDELNF